jgi:hypothetical protein
VNQFSKPLRYFFHILDGQKVFLDEVGESLSSQEEAIHQAGFLAAELRKAGEFCRSNVILVVNENGQRVFECQASLVRRRQRHRLSIATRGGSFAIKRNRGCETMDTQQRYIDDGYFIIQNAHLIDKATTYEEATEKGKSLKRSDPQSKVEIIFDGIAAEIPVPVANLIRLATSGESGDAMA